MGAPIGTLDRPGILSGGAVGRRLGALSETRHWPLILLAPSLVVIAAIILYPTIDGILLSFREMRLTRPDLGTGFVGLRHYEDLWYDDVFWGALTNTFKWVTMAVTLELALGMVSALALNRGGWPMKALAVLVMLPWFLPNIVAANIWALMLDSRIGVVNEMLVRLGLIDGYVAWFADPVTGLAAAVVVEAWHSYPFFTLLILAGLRAIPEDLYQGRGHRRGRAGSVLPPHHPADAPDDHRHRRDPARDRPGQLARDAAGADGGRPRQRHAGHLALRLRDGLRAVRLRLRQRAVGGHAAAPDDVLRDLPAGLGGVAAVRRRPADILAYAVATAFALFSVLPILWLLLTSFKSEAEIITDTITYWPASFALDNYATVWAQTDYPQLVWNSLVTTFYTVAICLSAGSLAAYGFSRHAFWGKRQVMLFYLVIRMFPAVLIIIPLFLTLRTVGLLDTRIGLALAYSSFLMPLVVLDDEGLLRRRAARSREGRPDRRLHAPGRDVADRAAAGEGGASAPAPSSRRSGRGTSTSSP